jgi:MFS family permease
MGIVGAGINIGPTLGPVLGGLLAQYLGWRAIFWFCAIITGAWLIPYIICVPETCRNVVGNGSIPPQGWNLTLVDFIRQKRTFQPSSPGSKTKVRFPNPLHTLKILFEKEMALILLYNSILYLIFMDVVVTLSTQFKAIYHFSDLQIGLCFLPYGFGCCVANIAQGYILDWNYRRVARSIGFTISRKKGDDLSNYPIETARIQPMYPTLVVGFVAVTVYGWVLQVKSNAAVPLILHFFIGMCITGSFSILNTLIVDLYPEAPGTATAANNLVRCSIGAAGTAVIESMITGMGLGWCFTFLAVLCAALMPILWLVETRGPAWRKERRAKLSPRQETTVPI